MNLSKLHGVADGVLLDSVIEEVDVKTGLVMWEWHALGHIPMGESFNAVPGVAYPWDYIHINSVDPGTSGDVLLSARNMWTLYDVDLQSGTDPVATGQPAQQLQARAGGPLLLAARRRIPARWADLGVRQRL